jgi:hypothetical protein
LKDPVNLVVTETGGAESSNLDDNRRAPRRAVQLRIGNVLSHLGCQIAIAGDRAKAIVVVKHSIKQGRQEQQAQRKRDERCRRHQAKSKVLGDSKFFASKLRGSATVDESR